VQTEKMVGKKCLVNLIQDKKGRTGAASRPKLRNRSKIRYREKQSLRRRAGVTETLGYRIP